MADPQDTKIQWRHIFKLIYIVLLWLCKWLWTIQVFLWKLLSRIAAIIIGIGVVGNIVSSLVLQDQGTWKITLHVLDLLLNNTANIIIILLCEGIIFFASRNPLSATYAASLVRLQQTINWKKLPRRWIVMLLVLILVIDVLWGVGPAALQALNRPAPPPPVDTGIHTQIIDGEMVGISGGKDAFDLNRLNSNYKEDAIKAMKKGDVTEANAYWTWAANDDTADAEAKIYVENQCILGINVEPITDENCRARSHKTIVVVVPLENSNVGRDILQGAYITQIEYNQLHRNGVPLYLLIANVGSSSGAGDAQVQVAKQIMQAVATDSTIIGITGWLPASSDLVRILSQSSPAAKHLPMISMVPLERAYIPGLVSVAPSLQDEARAAKTYITDKLHATNIAIVYPNDGSDRGLGSAFINESGPLKITPMSYYAGNTNDLQDVANRIINSGIDLVYFTGPYTDIKFLHTAVSGAGKGTGNNIQIVGGDITYQWIHASPEEINDFVGLSFTASAFPDEWFIQKVPIKNFPFYNSQAAASKSADNEEPPMIIDYKSAYDPQRRFNNQYIYDRADSDAILSYDATALMATAICQTLGSSCDNNTQKSPVITAERLWQTIQKFTPQHSFQGISGQISFTSDSSSPLNKAALVLFIHGRGTQNISVAGGKY